MHGLCLLWSWLSRCCVWPCVHQHSHSLSYFGLSYELLGLHPCSTASLPAGLQPFALCFVFCSALQMLISLLSTSAR